MLETVIAFGAINCLFEFVLLCMVPPRLRLRLLGGDTAQLCIHMGFLLVNLAVHWGTLIGTMSSILAFICSLVTVRIAQIVFGRITDGCLYTTGLIRYSASELK